MSTLFAVVISGLRLTLVHLGFWMHGIKDIIRFSTCKVISQPIISPDVLSKLGYRRSEKVYDVSKFNGPGIYSNPSRDHIDMH